MGATLYLLILGLAFLAEESASHTTGRAEELTCLGGARSVHKLPRRLRISLRAWGILRELRSPFGIRTTARDKDLECKLRSPPRTRSTAGDEDLVCKLRSPLRTGGMALSGDLKSSLPH